MNTEFLGLDFPAVASSLLLGIVTASFQAGPWESEPENDGAVLFEALGACCLESPRSHCRRLCKEALDLSLYQKREEPGTSIGISARSS